MGTQSTYTSLNANWLKAVDLWSNVKSLCADPGFFVGGGGGGGGVQAQRPENSLDNVFCFVFLVLNLFFQFTEGVQSNGLIKEKNYT